MCTHFKHHLMTMTVLISMAIVNARRENKRKWNLMQIIITFQFNYAKEGDGKLLRGSFTNDVKFFKGDQKIFFGWVNCKWRKSKKFNFYGRHLWTTPQRTFHFLHFHPLLPKKESDRKFFFKSIKKFHCWPSLKEMPCISFQFSMRK